MFKFIKFSVFIIVSVVTLPTLGDDFSTCTEQLAIDAKKSGFSEGIVNEVIPNLSPIKKVIKLDQRQPEFTETFSHYINLRVVPYRLTQGEKKRGQHQNLLNQLEKKYGVPQQYLLAFWGLETNYGRHKGKMSVLNALATLACDPRRSDYFTAELFNLFTLLDTNVVTQEQLLGSWAGAMGHMQFMPTAFYKYAVDGDGDGKIDIWESEVDALTSAANYLSQIGWNSNERWGRKVTLPKGFDFSASEFDKYYPLKHFKKLGVTTASGHVLSNYEIDAELFLPAGAKGPAFLLYPNFNVIMKWNLSKNYALSVGLLADQLQGAAKITFKEPQKADKYSRDEFVALQVLLNENGLAVGEPDGVWGPMTRAAIREYQLANGLVADGFPNREVFEQAGINKDNFASTSSKK